MYEMAGRSFTPSDNAHKDCWGYPFAFDLAFGNGVVKVRCEGVTALNEPDTDVPANTTSARQPEEVPAITTPALQPAAVGEQPGDLLNIAEAAEYANVSTRTIGNWLKAKLTNDDPMLPNVIRTDRIVKIPRGDLDLWRKKKKSTRKFTGSRDKKMKA